MKCELAETVTDDSEFALRKLQRADEHTVSMTMLDGVLILLKIRYCCKDFTHVPTSFGLQSGLWTSEPAII